MSRTKPTSVLRSIRISSKLEELLRHDAEAKGLSVNALVSSILTKYAEWDRYTEKFGFVTITRNGHRALVEGLNDEALERVSHEPGSQNPQEMALFWFKKLGLDAFLAYLSLAGRYGKWIEAEVQRHETNVVVLLKHELGPRYSKYVGDFMDHAVREVVGVAPKCQFGRDSVVLRFAAPD
jgi:hypothetical protein